jgi:hypothetical protein
MDFTGILSHHPGFYTLTLAFEQGDIDPLTVCFYLGITLLLACVILLMSPLRDRISGATQKIQGFGLNLEVSVLTLLFLISAALISSGIWLKLGTIKDELGRSMKAKEEADVRAKSLEEQIERLKKTSVEAWVALEGVDDVSKLKYPALNCDYQTSASDEVERCIISKGDFVQRVKVTFIDVNKGTKIKLLSIKETDAPNREWSYTTEFDPFKQSLKLSKGKPTN